MIVQANDGEVVADFLYKQLGDDDDALEAEFYALNPKVRAAIFTQTMLVALPSRKPLVTKKPTRSWE